jgi:uncharacterized integral membrane protein
MRRAVGRIAMIKRVSIAVVVVVALAVSALFTWLNPGELQLDLGVREVTVPVGVAFVAALAAGWLLGILSAALWVFRVSRDRRRLRSELKQASSASAGGLAIRDERG